MRDIIKKINAAVLGKFSSGRVGGGGILKTDNRTAREFITTTRLKSRPKDDGIMDNLSLILEYVYCINVNKLHKQIINFSLN